MVSSSNGTPVSMLPSACSQMTQRPAFAITLNLWMKRTTIQTYIITQDTDQMNQASSMFIRTSRNKVVTCGHQPGHKDAKDAVRTSSDQMAPKVNSHASQKDQVKTGLFQAPLLSTQNLSLNIKKVSRTTPELWDKSKVADKMLLLTGG